MSARTRVFVPPGPVREPDNRTVIARERPDLLPLPPLATSGLVAFYGSLLWLAIRLREGDTTHEPRLLRQQVWARLEEARERSEEQGIAAAEIDDAELVLIALLDSAALCRSGALRDVWKDRTLEMERYRGAIAGHRFFESLRRRMREGASPDLLELYYLALVSGFEGELSGRPAEIQQLLVDLRRLLVARAAPGQISLRTQVELPPVPAARQSAAPGLLMGVAFLFLVVLASLMALFVYAEGRDVGAFASALAQVLVTGREEGK